MQVVAKALPPDGEQRRDAIERRRDATRARSWRVLIAGGSLAILAACAHAGDEQRDVAHGQPAGTVGAGDGPCQVVAGGTDAHLVAINGRSADDLIAVGYDGTILAGRGDRWNALPRSVDQHLKDVAVADGCVFVVGLGGVVLRRVHDQFVVEPSPNRAHLLTVWADGCDRAFTAGADGTMLERAASGWLAVSSPTQGDIYWMRRVSEWAAPRDDAFRPIPGGTLLAVTEAELLEHRAGRWTAIGSPTPSAQHSVARPLVLLADSRAYAVTGTSIMHRVERNRQRNWETFYEHSAQLLALWTDGERLVAVGAHGSIVTCAL